MRTLTKEKAAEYLAHLYYEIDEDVRAVYRILVKNEDDPDEPLKLLKVSADTQPIGVMPLNFPPDVTHGRPYRLALAVITLEELKQIEIGSLRLPEGWQLGKAINKAINIRKARTEVAA